MVTPLHRRACPHRTASAVGIFRRSTNSSNRRATTPRYDQRPAHPAAAVLLLLLLLQQICSKIVSLRGRPPRHGCDLGWDGMQLWRLYRRREAAPLRQGDCRCVATGGTSDDAFAPLPAVRLTTIGRLKSTRSGHFCEPAPRRQPVRPSARARNGAGGIPGPTDESDGRPAVRSIPIDRL